MKIEPCPFCESTDVNCHEDTTSDHRQDWDFHVDCNSCDASGPHNKVEVEAIAEWNRRTSPLIPQQGGEQTTFEDWFSVRFPVPHLQRISYPFLQEAWNAGRAAVLPQVGELQEQADTDDMNDLVLRGLAAGEYGDLPQVGEAKPATVFDKYCDYCKTSGHTGSECWSTHAVQISEDAKPVAAPAGLGEAKPTPEKITRNRHIGGSEAYMATEHYNEGWNDCVDAFKSATPASLGEATSEHTFSAYCEYCKKLGHTDAKCWSTRPGIGLGEAKAVAPEGWQLVPIEPNADMFAAAREYHRELYPKAAAWPCGEAMGYYARMVAAAPVAEALPEVSSRFASLSNASQQLLNRVLSALSGSDIGEDDGYGGKFKLLNTNAQRDLTQLAIECNKKLAFPYASLPVDPSLALPVAAEIEDWETIAKAALIDLQATQKALSFWLPMVPPSEGDVAERVANDAWLLCGLESDEDSAEKLGWIQLSADINLDAQRWQAIRNVPDVKLGEAGIPCLAVPDSTISGDYANGEDADIAADEYIRRLAQEQP